MEVKQVIKKSAHGSTKWIDSIYFVIRDAKTYASYVLLKSYYWQRDENNINSIANRMRKIGFSRTYLKHIQQTTGTLTCTYCHKPDLIIELDGMKVPNRQKATIDHILALSKGGALFEYANICVCCGSCNSKKGNMSVEEFETKHKKYLDKSK